MAATASYQPYVNGNPGAATLVSRPGTPDVSPTYTIHACEAAARPACGPCHLRLGA